MEHDFDNEYKLYLLSYSHSLQMLTFANTANRSNKVVAIEMNVVSLAVKPHCTTVCNAKKELSFNFSTVSSPLHQNVHWLFGPPNMGCRSHLGPQAEFSGWNTDHNLLSQSDVHENLLCTQLITIISMTEQIEQSNCPQLIHESYMYNTVHKDLTKQSKKLV